MIAKQKFPAVKESAAEQEPAQGRPGRPCPRGCGLVAAAATSAAAWLPATEPPAVNPGDEGATPEPPALQLNQGLESPLPPRSTGPAAAAPPAISILRWRLS